MTSRPPTVWTWIVGTLIGVPLLYVLSFGPACWIQQIDGNDFGCAPQIYWPLGYVAAWSDSGFVDRALSWYATRGRAKYVGIPCDSEENSALIRHK